MAIPMPSPGAYETLIQAALAARLRAYAPYSRFLVGAALRARDGRVFTGVNVEQSSYGLTLCAERSAVVTAVGEGAREFDAIAIATTGRHGPCGACRQFLYEFAPGLAVVLADADGKLPSSVTTLAELLPGGFRLAGD